MSKHDTPPASPRREDIHWSFGRSDIAVVLVDGAGGVTHARDHGRIGVGSEPGAGSALRRVSPVVPPPTAAT